VIAVTAEPRLVEVSHRRMLVIALPMTLSHVTTPLLGLVDATVIGQLGEAHLLGAVALGSVIFDFLFWSFGSLRMATAGLTAQATGAGDAREIDRTLARALAVAGIVGLLIVLLQWPIAALAFRSAEQRGRDGRSRTYFAVIWSAPFTPANYVISARPSAGPHGSRLLCRSRSTSPTSCSRWVRAGLDWGRGRGARQLLAEWRGWAWARVLRRSAPTRSASPAEVFDRAAMLRTLAVNRTS
jgi:MATE family multidrug resistance protein